MGRRGVPGRFWPEDSEASVETVSGAVETAGRTFRGKSEVPPELQDLVCGLAGAAPLVFAVPGALMLDFSSNFAAEMCCDCQQLALFCRDAVRCRNGLLPCPFPTFPTFFGPALRLANRFSLFFLRRSSENLALSNGGSVCLRREGH